MKHFEMNSFSLWRASEAWAFFKIFLRLVPRFPGDENLRMFSLLRLIFSFFAFTRDANKEVEERVTGYVKGVNAYGQKYKVRSENERNWNSFESD